MYVLWKRRPRRVQRHGLLIFLVPCTANIYFSSLQNAFKFSWVPSCGAWLWKWKWQKLPKNIVFQKVTKDFHVPQELFQRTKSQNLSHVNVDFFQTAQVKAIKDLKRSNLSLFCITWILQGSRKGKQVLSLRWAGRASATIITIYYLYYIIKLYYNIYINSIIRNYKTFHLFLNH